MILLYFLDLKDRNSEISATDEIAQSNKIKKEANQFSTKLWYLILKKIVKSSGNGTQNRRTSLQKRAKDVSMEFTLVWYACNSQWSYF